MRKENIIYFFLLYCCLSVIRFFDISLIPASLLYYNYYLLFFGSLFFVLLFYKKSYSNSFSGLVLFLLLAIFLSGLSSILFWRQSFIDTLKVLSYPMSYVFFFLLSMLAVEKRQIEKVIVTMGVLYMIVFTLAYLLYPTTLFGNIGHWGTERGFQRISVRGLGFLFLLSFLALNKYLKNSELKWLLLYLLTLIFIIMKLSRTLMLVSFGVSVWFILNKSSLLKKITAVLSLSVFIFFVTQMDFFKILVHETETQVKTWENDVRVRSAKFYLQKFSPVVFAKIMGNGPAYYKSLYAARIGRIETRYGYYTVDIGYIGIYVIYGIQTLLALFMIFRKILKVNCPEENLYSKYFLFFIYLVSFIIPVFMGSDFIPSIVLALFVLTIGMKSEDTSGMIPPLKKNN